MPRKVCRAGTSSIGGSNWDFPGMACEDPIINE